jgi:isochorismate pyruvate lyase
MKIPRDCETLDEIRCEIDRLDRDVVALLGQRFEYVKAAAKFKADSDSVKAPDRLQSLLKQRGDWAIEAGLKPEVVQSLYRDLVNYFIEEELKHWNQSSE